MGLTLISDQTVVSYTREPRVSFGQNTQKDD